MNWQLWATLAIILSASCYLAFRLYKSVRGRKAGCGGGCGCAPKENTQSSSAATDVFIPSNGIGLRKNDSARTPSE
jgi:hypothetical protein